MVDLLTVISLRWCQQLCNYETLITENEFELTIGVATII